MKTQGLRAAQAVQSEASGGQSPQAERCDSAIRRLGAGGSGGTNTQCEAPAFGLVGSKPKQLETRLGWCMESLDDDWDIEGPAAAHSKASPAPTPTAPAVATSGPPAPPTQRSKVQLVAEAFRQRAGTKPAARPTSVAPVSVQSRAGAPQVSPGSAVNSVVVAPVVEVEQDSLELQEILPEPSPLPSTRAHDLVDVSNPVAETPLSASVAGAETSKPSRSHHTANRACQDSVLSLDTADAVQFFSSAPPPTRMDIDQETEQVFDVHRANTPDQFARRRYLRRLVLRVMLVAAAFVVVVVYLLWQRGLLRVIS